MRKADECAGPRSRPTRICIDQFRPAAGAPACPRVRSSGISRAVTRRFPPQLLLVLAFVLGQWFAVVHSTQHELASVDKLVACEVCAAGHSAALPPPAPLAALDRLPAIEVPLAAPVSAPRRSLWLRTLPRGPPSNLA